MSSSSSAPTEKPLGLLKSELKPRTETKTLMDPRWESPLMLLVGFLMGTLFQNISVDSGISQLTWEQLQQRPNALKRVITYYNTLLDPVEAPMWYNWGLHFLIVTLGLAYLAHYWTKPRTTGLDTFCLMTLFVALRQTYAYVISQRHVFLTPSVVESANTGDWDKEQVDDVVLAIQSTNIGHVGIFLAFLAFALARLYQTFAVRTYFDRQYDLQQEERLLKREGVPVFPNEYERMREELRRSVHEPVKFKKDK